MVWGGARSQGGIGIDMLFTCFFVALREREREGGAQTYVPKRTWGGQRYEMMTG